MASSLVIVGEVKNQEWINAFGTFQEIYRQEDGINADEVAKNLLKGVEQTGSVEALGNIDAVAGFAIGIEDDYTGLVGVFQIDTDTHTWKDGVHTMSLDLNFETIMDLKSYRTTKSKKKTKSVVDWSGLNE